MKRIILCLFVCLASAYLASISQADEVSDLYQATVPVPDRTQLSKEAGIDQAFAQVIIKLTGNSGVMQLPQLSPFLPDPRALMDAVGYSDLSQKDEADTTSIGLDVSFDQQLVDRIVHQAQLPILPSSRPRFLIWLITDDINYGRRFIHEAVTQQNLLDDYAPQLLSIMDSAMHDRGIPYLMPIYDLEDQLSLPVNQAWSLNTDLITSAARRYKADGWFAIRLYTASNGEIRGAWAFEKSGKRSFNDFRGTEMEPTLKLAVDDILDSLLQDFTYLPQLDTNQLLVQVEGVSSLQHYRSVLEFFRNIQMVGSVQLFSVEGERLVLAMEVQGRPDRLHSDLLRSGRLKSEISEDERSIGRLTYRWIAE